MTARTLLVALIVAATAAFVIGVSIERHNETNHRETASRIAHGESGEAVEGTRHEEPEPAGRDAASEAHEELRPFGIDVEAWPFVAVAALASLALAAAGWLRPRHLALLVLIVAAMLAFATLDVREAVHQADIDETGLAILAGIVAALHLGAAGASGVLIRDRGQSSGVGGLASRVTEIGSPRSIARDHE